MTSKEQDEETFSTASAESGCLLAASFFFPGPARAFLGGDQYSFLMSCEVDLPL